MSMQSMSAHCAAGQAMTGRAANGFKRVLARTVWLLVAMLATQAWSGIASAQTGCVLSAVGSPPAQGISGSQVSLDFVVTDGGAGCVAPNVTVAISTDTTGGGSLISDALPAITVGTPSTVIVELGPNDGQIDVDVSCAPPGPSCSGSPLLLWFETNNVYALTAIDPAGGSKAARPGETVPLEFRATRNGVAYSV
ncbi:MAG TPA: hypothetical protein VFY12_08070, partial [Arenimonas sp.]|nr:hypothetical protein [Arenimonas sp.]